MKKLIVIGMAFVILCVCVACGVADKADKNDNIEEAVNVTQQYIEETYEDGCTSEAFSLNDETRESWKALFDKDLDECIAIVIIRDSDGNFVDCLAVSV